MCLLVLIIILSNYYVIVIIKFDIFDDYLFMKIKDVIGVTVFVILIYGIIIGIYFLGFAGVSNLFGIQYDSLSSLGIFVISVFIIGFFVELIFDSLTILAVEKVVNYYIAFLVQFLFMFISEWIVLAIVEA